MMVQTVVVHHVRKPITRYEIGSAFRGSSALHAVGDSYMLLTRPSPQLPTVELRFQFRYAAAQPPRLLQLDPNTLWFSSTGQPSATPAVTRRKVEQADVTQALAGIGEPVRYTQLRDQIMDLTECSKRTTQLAITSQRPAGKACWEQFPELWPRSMKRDDGPDALFARMHFKFYRVLFDARATKSSKLESKSFRMGDWFVDFL